MGRVEDGKERGKGWQGEEGGRRGREYRRRTVDRAHRRKGHWNLQAVYCIFPGRQQQQQQHRQDQRQQAENEQHVEKGAAKHNKVLLSSNTFQIGGVLVDT